MVRGTTTGMSMTKEKPLAGMGDAKSGLAHCQDADVREGTRRSQIGLAS